MYHTLDDVTREYIDANFYIEKERQEKEVEYISQTIDDEYWDFQKQLKNPDQLSHTEWLETVRERCETLIEKVKKEDSNKKSVRIVPFMNEGKLYFEILFVRKETDMEVLYRLSQEYAPQIKLYKRKRREEEFRSKKEQKELAEYQRLKEKYGDK